MKTQIAVRIDDELVSYIDDIVREGAGSRAAVVTTALELHRQRRVAEQDAAILAEQGDYADLNGLAEFAALDAPDD